MGFLTSKKFYNKYGFETVDSAYPYFELLALKLNSPAPNPSFTQNTKKGTYNNTKEFSFIFSNQCPYMEEYRKIMAAVCKKREKST
jgi:hypothetical protein